MNEASLNYVAETLPCKGKKGDREKEGRTKALLNFSKG